MNDDQWARDKGIKRWCGKHKIEYDPMIGCPEHLKEEEAEKLAKKQALQVQGKQALEQFDLKFIRKKRWPWSK